VPPFLDLLGGFVHRHPRFWLWLGNLESRRLAEELRTVQITMPIFVAGLARSGSTLLHEIVASHPGVATHRAKDYPMVYTPFWWRQATSKRPPSKPRERAHQDRIVITSESPEALEEMLWMAFYPGCHDPARDNRLDANRRHRSFEAFYALHIRKLLLAEKATRYAAKANYHVARLPYLARMFSDAKILIPVRAPATHIASLMRQHARFSSGQRNNSRALAFMQRTGHFEFGRDRRPINLGNQQRVKAILNAWSRGEEVLGWALYWDMVYAYLNELLASQPRIRSMARIVRYEDVCACPEKTISALLDQCRLIRTDAVLAKYAGKIRAPDYYDSPFNAAQLALIGEITSSTARRWGY
jgi:hypothetical protein